ncbi:MAG TPA: tetratricopeptide repeat protein, partial [Thermoanaerobaculia bacterium]|nr:tetratricopeptide repeat protein [Thermoanaerobaculia bacterium]
GAGALILGSIAEVGGEYVVTGEVLQPPGGRTVVTETARARGRDGILDALEAVTRKVRERLGEPLPAIEENLVPLEKVTTADLEALRAYSLGLEKIAEGATDEAILLLERAVARDPQFAAARAKLGIYYFFGRRDPEVALDHWDRALSLRDRLPERERLYVEGSKAWLGTPDEMVRAWSLMANLYPDVTAGHHNLGYVHLSQNRFREAAAAFQRATETKDVLVFTSFHSLGRCQLALGHHEAALQSFETAGTLEENPLAGGLIDTLIVLERYGAARREIDEVARRPDPDVRFLVAVKRMDLALEQGRFAEALEEVASARPLVEGLPNDDRLALVLDYAEASIREALGESAGGRDPDRILDRALEQLENALPLTISRQLPQTTLVGKLAARSGRLDVARRALEAVEEHAAGRQVPLWQAYVAMLRGEIALASGERTEALTHLRQATAGPSVFEAHESLARALEANEDLTAALAEWLWLSEHRGLAWAEWFDHGFGRQTRILAWNRADYHRGRLLETLGDPAAAAERYRAFLERFETQEGTDPLLEEARRRLRTLPGSSD